MPSWDSYKDRIKDPYSRIFSDKPRKGLREKVPQRGTPYKPNRVLTPAQRERLDKKTKEWIEKTTPNIDPGTYTPFKVDGKIK